MKTGATIVIADDEIDLLGALKQSLVDEGYRVLAAANGAEALNLVYKHKPQLLILDIHMPGLTGHEVCRRLRREPRFAPIPIIFLTVDSRIEERVTGLDGGGDDYVVKPFDLREFKARVRALLRRSGAESPVREETDLKVGALELDAKRRTVHHDGRAIKLTPIEYSLLRHMMARAGEVVSVEQLIEAGWGHDRSAGSANLIRWHISNLRRKLELDPLHPRILCTQSHFGYVLCSESHATRP